MKTGDNPRNPCARLFPTPEKVRKFVAEKKKAKGKGSPVIEAAHTRGGSGDGPSLQL